MALRAPQQDRELTAADIQPVAHETRDRVITGTITVAPVVILVVCAVLAWGRLLHWSDVIVFALLYGATTLGITVGFHRLLTHRSFATSPALRGVFAVLGSVAIEGPVISWVADHRKHHAFSDRLGDPHSPHVDHGSGWTGALRGLSHAHLGWLFVHTQRGSKERYAPDLLRDPVVRAVDRWFVLWAVSGFAAAFGLGCVIGGSVGAGLTALPSFGEAWHNNHHAFPTSAAHGLRWWQVDVSAATIRLLERLGLAWDVVRVDSGQQGARRRAT